MIKISKMTDYGVVALTQIATARSDMLTSPEIALFTGLTVPTVAKLMRKLARAGVLVSHRGAHGGYSLASDPSEITIAEIVAALEGPIAVTACVDNSDDNCGVEQSCPMRGGWDRINRIILDTLETMTLADMMAPEPFTPPGIKAADVVDTTN